MGRLTLRLLLPLLCSFVLMARPGPGAAQAPPGVPMLFTGTATLDGGAVPAGTTIQVFDREGVLVAQTTTGSLAGAQSHYWQLVLFAPNLEDQELRFHVLGEDGRPLLPGAIAVYDAVRGPGRAHVNVVTIVPRLAASVLAPLVAARTAEGESLLRIAWAQHLATGQFLFFAPGAVSTLTEIEPNTAILLNLARPALLRISGRPPQTVAPGGVWVSFGQQVSVQVVA